MPWLELCQVRYFPLGISVSDPCSNVFATGHLRCLSYFVLICALIGKDVLNLEDNSLTGSLPTSPLGSSLCKFKAQVQMPIFYSHVSQPFCLFSLACLNVAGNSLSGILPYEYCGSSPLHLCQSFITDGCNCCTCEMDIPCTIDDYMAQNGGQLHLFGFCQTRENSRNCGSSPAETQAFHVRTEAKKWCCNWKRQLLHMIPLLT